MCHFAPIVSSNPITRTEEDELRREAVNAVVTDIIKYGLIGGIINGIIFFIAPGIISFLVTIGVGLWVLYESAVSIVINIDELVKKRMYQSDQDTQQD